MHKVTDVLLLTTMWCLLGGWIGAMLLFALVVAPVAFSVLPGPELAGKLVGPILRSLNFYGIGAGFALAALGAALARGRLVMALPLAMSTLCAVSQFVITAGITEIRPLAFGTVPDPTALARFGQLHGLSMLVFSATGIAALGLATLHARADVVARRGP